MGTYSSGPIYSICIDCRKECAPLTVDENGRCALCAASQPNGNKPAQAEAKRP